MSGHPSSFKGSGFFIFKQICLFSWIPVIKVLSNLHFLVRLFERSLKKKISWIYYCVLSIHQSFFRNDYFLFLKESKIEVLLVWVHQYTPLKNWLEFNVNGPRKRMNWCADKWGIIRPEWIDQFSKKPIYIFDLLSIQEPESNHAFWIKTLAIYKGRSA